MKTTFKNLLFLTPILLLSACKKDDLPKGIEYEVEFIGAWSSADFPVDYPDNAHFSPIIGITYADGPGFWEPGQLASAGMEEMAETGKTKTLESELQPLVDNGDALQLVIGDKLETGSSTNTFTIVVDKDHTVVSLVSMLGPSPDWFVAGTAYLRDFSDQWLDNVIVQMNSYDAGTDSGLSFKSANEDTQPREVISQITDPALYDQNKPIAVLKFTRKQ
ncbi:MAG: spondin domain-containing protein [Saprospiraceae bacterium]|nr:spondin domain-containing protein [Saprospiraceae bacterium]